MKTTVKIVIHDAFYEDELNKKIETACCGYNVLSVTTNVLNSGRQMHGDLVIVTLLLETK